MRVVWWCGRVLLAAGLGIALGLVACSRNELSDPEPQPEEWTINNLVATTGWFPVVRPDSNAFSVARRDSADALGNPLSCTVWSGEQVRALDRLTPFAVPDTMLYPGALLQWASLFEPERRPIRADRAQGALELLVQGGVAADGSVAQVSPDSVGAWRARTLEELGELPVGDWMLSVGIVYSEDHLAVVGGLVPSAVADEVESRLAFRDGHAGRALVRLQRTHHTVACGYPGSAAAAFAPTVEPDNLADQMAAGNPPVWVEAVDYGECLLVLVEADAAPDVVADAVINAFTAGVSGGTPDPDRLALDDLPDLSVEVCALGMDADAAAAAFAAGQPSLTAFLQEPPDDPGALPAITASLQALRNGGPLWRRAAASFELSVCEPHAPVLDDVLWAFHAVDAHTVTESVHLATNRGGWFEYDPDIDYPAEQLVIGIPDLLGDGGVAEPPPIARRPFLLPDMVGGRPAVELYYLPILEGLLHSELNFDGRALVGQDYTIFVVCGVPEFTRIMWTNSDGTLGCAGSPSEVEYFLHGAGDGTRRNMKVGWESRGHMVYSHFPYHLQFEHLPDEGWHVYAIRYGLYTGLSVFCDGELLDTDPTDNYGLLEYSGATLCACWHDIFSTNLGVFWLAEITAYRGAGSDDDMVAESARLMQKYGLAP